MSERSGGRERSEQSGASERVSGASERANGRASDPILTSQFLFIHAHSALVSSCLVIPTQLSRLFPFLLVVRLTSTLSSLVFILVLIISFLLSSIHYFLL